MLVISLLLNIVVLVPVLVVLSRNGPAATRAWGVDTPARRILAAIYAAILLGSIGLLALMAFGTGILAWAQALLAIQITYKILTVPFAGLRNPVVLSNIAIAIVHSVTLALTYGAAA